MKTTENSIMKTSVAEAQGSGTGWYEYEAHGKEKIPVETLATIMMTIITDQVAR